MQVSLIVWQVDGAISSFRIFVDSSDQSVPEILPYVELQGSGFVGYRPDD